METARFLFKCRVSVSIKNKLHVVDRLFVGESHDKRHHLESFDETVSAYGEDWESDEPIGYYECDAYLVYETIHYSGGQDGTEYDSDIEFGEFKLIAGGC